MGAVHLEAHGEILNLFVHVLLFLQGNRCFIQPGERDVSRLVSDGLESILNKKNSKNKARVISLGIPSTSYLLSLPF